MGSDKMQFTIYGYNQIKLLDLGLDTTDIVLLRYVENFINSGNMIKEIFNGETYYWLNYKNIVKDLPILNLKKDAIYRRLKYMTNIKILNHITVKNKGVYSYYALGNEYKNLVSKSTPKRKSPENFYENSPADSAEKLEVLKDLKPYPSGSVSITPKDLSTEQKIPLLEHSSTKCLKNIKKNTNTAAIVNYLNVKCGTSYKTSTKKTQSLINSREREGFILEDFYRVIDNKTKQWLNTDMEQYLRPETLFGTKFESYLNQSERKRNQNDAYKENSGEIKKCEVGFSL